MAFGTVNSWTLSGLVRAFIDLAIAYTLLCGSAFAFFPSKLLSLFGLNLPCPCSGFFGYQNNNLCLQRLLIDLPRSKIFAVEELVQNRFPYDLVLFDHKSCNLHADGHGNRKFGNGVIGEETCSTSLSGPALLDSNERESGCDSKGKRIMNQRSKSGIRRRRRAALGNGKLFHALSSNNKDSVGIGALHPFYDGSGMRTAISGSLDAANRTEDSFLGNPGDRLCSVRDDRNVIQVLEQALEEEKAAHAVLYQELEKERAAAATAADEAMAMIFRLQEDKASIEMEARQYQRVIEEKFAYDEEEMKILKEILVRREKEIHFLEMELQTYEQMNFSGNEQVEGDSGYKIIYEESKPSHSIDSHENPQPKPLSENSKSVGGEEVAICAKWPSNCGHICSPPFEKEIMSKHEEVASGPSSSQGLVQKTTKDGKHWNQEGCNMYSTMLETESTVYDVHVIDDKTVLSKEDHGRENGPWSTAASLSEAQNTKFSSDSPTMCMAETEQNVHDSNFVMHGELLVSNDSLHKTSSVDSVRHSPIVVDDERLKIDNEIEQLRERLRIVQEEKEKLTFSAEHRELVNTKVKLVEDILSQLQEIQQLRKHVQPASLPPSSSQVNLKRRHCRSASKDCASD